MITVLMLNSQTTLRHEENAHKRNGRALLTHAPLWLQLALQRVGREDLVAGEPADTACARANCTFGLAGDGTAVGANAACVAHGVAVLELLGR